MGKTICLATNNAHKAEEISKALAFPGWEFKTLAELGIESDPEENAETFEGNARIKARAAFEKSGLPTLADDSGIVVDALGGAPGVHSARYAGDHGSDTANNEKLLAELEGVPDEERTGRFVCAIAFIDEDGSETLARGTVEGRIGYEPIGENGFGYDPLFWPEVFDYSCTLAQVSREDKELVSHRGNALRDLARKLAARQ